MNKNLREAVLNDLKTVFEQKSNPLALGVEDYPGNPALFQIRHPRGHILVRYVRSQYATTSSSDSAVQKRAMSFEAVILLRDLRTTADAEPYIELARKRIQGFKIPGCSIVTIASDGFVAENNGIWQYNIVFGSSTLSANPDVDDTRPPFKTITLNRHTEEPEL
ncbi:MAG: Gp37 family protein [bacterium]